MTDGRLQLALRSKPAQAASPIIQYGIDGPGQFFHPDWLGRVPVHPGRVEDFFSPSMAKAVKANMGILLWF
jgi:microcystin-dependent protein